MTKIIFSSKNFLVKIILGERKLLDGQMSSGQMFPGQMSLTVDICLKWSKEPTFKVWSKLGHQQQRYLLFWVGVGLAAGWRNWNLFEFNPIEWS